MITSIYDLNDMSNEELIELGRKNRAILSKRLKRLQEADAKHPGRYSTHGLKTLEEGIPMISVTMGRNTLKANVLRSERLRQMKTTSATGAKKHQTEQLKNLLGLKPEGRLNKADSDKLKSARDYVEKDPEVMNNYWEAFDRFQEEMLFSQLDSDQLLELFTSNFSDQFTQVGDEIDTLFKQVEDYAQGYYEEQQQKNKMLGDIGLEGGWRI